MKKRKLSFINVIFIMFLFTYLINLLWEIIHSSLYNWNSYPLKNSIYFFIPKILLATLYDAIIIFIILLINSIIRRGFNWILSPKKTDYIILLILGLIFAIGIEVFATITNLWNYNQHMPLILGIGLTPLIQLSITSILILFLINKGLPTKE